MIKTVQDLKTKFKKEIETLKRTETEIKMKLNNSITQLEIQRKCKGSNRR